MYVTGDLHGDIDIHKLNSENFPQNKFLTKDNYVIVCGDFGLVWNGSSEEKYWLDWLHQKNFITLFVDGNHENHTMLDNMPVTQWNGGKVHKINNSVIHLMRGQVYVINGIKFFIFGGADSIDKQWRVKDISWWERELPSNEEYEEGLRNLEKHNWQVDYVISHDCSKSVFEKLMAGLWTKKLTSINTYFETIDEKLDYKQWYFGHYHDDIQVDPKHRLLYQQVLKIE